MRGSCHFKPRHRQIRISTAPHIAVLSLMATRMPARIMSRHSGERRLSARRSHTDWAPVWRRARLFPDPPLRLEETRFGRLRPHCRSMPNETPEEALGQDEGGFAVARIEMRGASCQTWAPASAMVGRTSWAFGEPGWRRQRRGRPARFAKHRTRCYNRSHEGGDWRGPGCRRSRPRRSPGSPIARGWRMRRCAKRSGAPEKG